MQILTTEVLKDKKIKVPEIKGVRDLLSKKRDGTITSQGPIVVKGKNLNMFDLDRVRLCLVCSSNTNQRIDICNIYKYSSEQVIVSLPVLVPGEYFPAIKILEKDKEAFIYIISMPLTVLSGKYSEQSTKEEY